MTLSMQHKVCSAHFQPEDVISFDEHLVKGEVVRIPRHRATLRAGALPVLLENYPKYLQPTIKTRKPPTKRQIKQPEKKTVANTENPNEALTSTPPQSPSPPSPQQTEPTLDAPAPVVPQTSQIQSPQSEEATSPGWSHFDVTSLKLPENWVTCNTLDSSQKFIACINPSTFQIDKSITFRGQDPPHIIFRGTVKFVGAFDKPLTTLKEAQRVVNCVANMRVCCGTGLKCKPFSVFCNGPALPKKKRCAACLKEYERLRKKEARHEKVESNTKVRKAKRKFTLQSLRRSKVNLLKKVRS